MSMSRLGAAGAHRVGGGLDLRRERSGAGEAEDVVDPVRLAPIHGLGPSIVAVAAQQDPGLGPALADVVDEAAHVSAHLATRGRLAGAKDNIADILARVRKAGFPVALCSNLASPYGPAARSALSDRTDVEVFAYAVGAIKPEPAIYAACRRGAGPRTGPHPVRRRYRPRRHRRPPDLRVPGAACHGTGGGNATDLTFIEK